jgi:alpha-L-fucosidase
MQPNEIDRKRRALLMGAGATLAAAGAGMRLAAQTASTANDAPAPSADQVRRMQWWHEAKFGMFIHFGLYSQHARHEWAMEDEAIPVAEYQKLATVFDPAPGCQRRWAKLAKAAGMKYRVMTTKHHEASATSTRS